MEEIKEEIKQEETKTFTQEEVDKMLQAETDRKTSKALETAKAKWQEEYDAKLEQTKSEAEKLAKMSESERFKAEFDKQKEQFDSERKQFMQEKLELQTVKELSAEGLPTEFSNFVMSDSADQIKANISSLKATFELAIEKAVNEKLQGTTPKTATKQTTGGITKEQFKTMSIADKTKLFNEDSELYNQLKG